MNFSLGRREMRRSQVFTYELQLYTFLVLVSIQKRGSKKPLKPPYMLFLILLPHPAIHYIQELVRIRLQVNEDELVQSLIFNQGILLSFKLRIIQPEEIF